MNRRNRIAVGVLIFGLIVGTLAASDQELPATGPGEDPILNVDQRGGPPPPPFEMPNAENHLDVVYLPDRIAGGEKDRFVKMNIHVPKGPGPFPAVVCVHGGGYWSGDKDYTFTGSSSPTHKNLTRLVENGFVAVNLNYIVGRGVRPQVYWDWRSAIRYLRANAEKYKIDPGRIAAWGHSAGGWLSGSCAFTTADDLYPVTTKSVGPDGKPRNKGEKFAVPFDDPQPAYGDQSSRITAVAADFWENDQFLSADDAAVLTYTGLETPHKISENATKGGADLTVLEIQDPKLKGKNLVHGPDWKFAVKGPGFEGTPTLLDATFQFFEDRLKKSPRTVPPEARPNLRQFTDSVDVTLLAASPDTEIRFTLDGSEPGPSSPVAKGSIKITNTTTIKAMAQRPGEQASAVTALTFTKTDKLPPKITAPEGPILPVAKVGTPYSLEFQIDDPQAKVGMVGHLDFDKRKKTMDGLPQESAGLILQGRTLQGTPSHPGIYTFQILASGSSTGPSGARCYVLKVEP